MEMHDQVSLAVERRRKQLPPLNMQHFETPTGPEVNEVTGSSSTSSTSSTSTRNTGGAGAGGPLGSDAFRAAKNHSERALVASINRELSLQMRQNALRDALSVKMERARVHARKEELLKVQRLWLPIISFIPRFEVMREKMHHQRVLRQIAQRKASASSIIGRAWRRQSFRRREKRYGPMLAMVGKFAVRLLFQFRCRQRIAAASTLRTFIKSYVTEQSPLVVIIRNFAFQVVKCQRLARSFIACRQARLILLTKMWERLERTQRRRLVREVSRKVERAKTQELRSLEAGREDLTYLTSQWTRMRKDIMATLHVKEETPPPDLDPHEFEVFISTPATREPVLLAFIADCRKKHIKNNLQKGHGHAVIQPKYVMQH